jgi:hypothetical protein
MEDFVYAFKQPKLKILDIYFNLRIKESINKIKLENNMYD